MMKKSMYDVIKKQNGEAFAKVIRRYDSSLFELENFDKIVRYAGRNALPILGFLESLKLQFLESVPCDKNPFELLKEAGYKAFYVDSFEKQNSIKKYFSDGEELCTFSDNKRFENYHIIHCVKEGAEKLSRSDFMGKEQREDEYGTSVLSIQIAKEDDFIKICNRYNHTVNNPDNTFCSNPDNIILGLTASLEDYFDIKLLGVVGIPDGYTYQNGQLFKYHTEDLNCYIGDGFYVQDGDVYYFNKDYEVVADIFVFNLKDKKITSFIQPLEEEQERNLNILAQEIERASLQLVKNQDGSHSLLKNQKPFLKIREGAIEEMVLETETLEPEIDEFSSLKKLTLLNIRKVDSYFLSMNAKVEEIIAPNLEEAGSWFVSECCLKKAFFPKLRSVGGHSFSDNDFLDEVILPSLKTAGYVCFSNNKVLKKIEADLLQVVDAESVCNNPWLQDLSMKALDTVGERVFNANKRLKKIVLNKLTEIECDSFNNMPLLNEIEMKGLIFSSGDSFCHLKSLKRFVAPELENLSFGENLVDTGLEFLFLPKLEKASLSILKDNPYLKHLYLPAIDVRNQEFLPYKKYPTKRCLKTNGFCLKYKKGRQYE